MLLRVPDYFEQFRCLAGECPHTCCAKWEVVIDPDTAGKGFGKQFVAFYEDYARQNGCRCLRMDTNSRNARARAMYRMLGYREAGIVPCVFNGIEGVELVLLEKTL